jgi:hypothetical protein
MFTSFFFFRLKYHPSVSNFGTNTSLGTNDAKFCPLSTPRVSHVRGIIVFLHTPGIYQASFHFLSFFQVYTIKSHTLVISSLIPHQSHHSINTQSPPSPKTSIHLSPHKPKNMQPTTTAATHHGGACTSKRNPLLHIQTPHKPLYPHAQMG